LAEESTIAIHPNWKSRAGYTFAENRLKSPVLADFTPVPVEMAERVWPGVRDMIRGPKTGIGREYDVDRLHHRLLLGIDRVWIAGFTRITAGELVKHPFCGLVITSIGAPPKSGPQLFFKEKSIFIHLIAGVRLYTWIDEAVEKIVAYAKAQEVRQAFVLARVGWRRYALRFYPHYSKMGLARDRFSARGRNPNNGRHCPGRFLHVEPLPSGVKFDTAIHSRRRNYIYPPKKGETHDAIAVQ
jgi:hypothetical protein